MKIIVDGVEFNWATIEKLCGLTTDHKWQYPIGVTNKPFRYCRICLLGQKSCTKPDFIEKGVLKYVYDKHYTMNLRQGVTYLFSVSRNEGGFHNCHTKTVRTCGSSRLMVISIPDLRIQSNK